MIEVKIVVCGVSGGGARRKEKSSSFASSSNVVVYVRNVLRAVLSLSYVKLRLRGRAAASAKLVLGYENTFSSSS